MENYDSTNIISNSSAPCLSDDSIFFNLILGTNYENTKENCLQFIINLSRHIYFPKRELFKILINELTLNEYQNKIICNDESIYLIRQIIKKYSRNNILNALYDYISSKDEITGSNGENNECINSQVNSSMKKNCSAEKDPSLNSKKIIEKDNEGEENELNKNDEEQKKDFLSKKRKDPSSKDPIKEKKDKKRKKGKKVKKDNNKEKKENNKDKKDIDNDEIGKDIKDEENNDDCEGEDEEDKKKIEDDKEIKKENEEEKADKGKKKTLIKENENENEEVKGEIKEEKNKKIIKQENDENKEEKKNFVSKNKNSKQKSEEKRNDLNKKRVLKTVPLLKSKGFTYFVCKNDKKFNQTKIKSKRFFAPEEIIKLESSEEMNLNSSLASSPIKNKNPLNKNDKGQMDILTFLNLGKSQIIHSELSKQNENEFRSHLVKYQKEKNMIISYKLKKYVDNGKIILFECNNKKCKGKGEYDIDKKIFKEMVGHNICFNSHKMASIYYVSRDILLNDDDCHGYQLLKNNTFIKDKIVIFLK